MANRYGNTFTEQVRRNAVALISLVIAITSLTYNTWRNEVSEENRTQRAAAMEILMNLGELQQVIWHHHYDQDFEGRGNLIDAWARVFVIRDIGTILDDPVPATTLELFETFESVRGELDTSYDAEREFYEAINAVRRDTLALLERLD